MIRTIERKLGVKLRAQVAAVSMALMMFVGALLWGTGNAAAQLPSRNSISGSEWFQSGRQQPPRLTPKQVKKLDSNPAKDGGAGKNPNPQRPGNPLAGFSPEEMALVPRGIERPAPLLYVFRQLDLSAEQRMKLRNLTVQTGNEILVLRNLQRAQNLALDEAIYSRNFDPKVVEQRAADLAGTQAEIIKAQARVMAQIRQILTPDQASRFRELLIEERNRQNQQPPPPIR